MYEHCSEGSSLGTSLSVAIVFQWLIFSAHTLICTGAFCVKLNFFIGARCLLFISWIGPRWFNSISDLDVWEYKYSLLYLYLFLQKHNAMSSLEVRNSIAIAAEVSFFFIHPTWSSINLTFYCWLSSFLITYSYYITYSINKVMK